MVQNRWGMWSNVYNTYNTMYGKDKKEVTI